MRGRDVYRLLGNFSVVQDEDSAERSPLSHLNVLDTDRRPGLSFFRDEEYRFRVFWEGLLQSSKKEIPIPTDTDSLLPQIETFRRWLDDQAGRGDLVRRVPLIVMIYATKHSQSADAPSPAYVRRGLEIGLEATGKGWADGVVTYCLPKDRTEFTSAVAAVYKKIKS